MTGEVVVTKAAVMIPVTDELLFDNRRAGERQVPDAARWRTMWEHHQQTPFDRILRLPPPWETWQPTTPPTFVPFPRTARIEAHIRDTLAEGRLRVGRAVDELRGRGDRHWDD